MPFPLKRCMMNPSPPKKPLPIFSWKNIESSTPTVEARNADFWATISFPGLIWKGLMEPGKLDEKAIIPGPPSAVYLFWKRLSPENARPSILPIPPFEEVSIFMFWLIHDIAPFSVIMVSPGSRLQMTTGKGSPSMVKFIVYLLT